MLSRVYTFSITILFLLTFGLVKLVYPQDISRDTIAIESVTVYSTKNTATIRPGTKVVFIDSLVLMEKANLSISELLTENSPIFIKTYGRGSMATASFRGTGASHTKVMWNGVKVNSPMSGEVDFSLIPMYFIDDVSIHFGQSSMSFGSGGLGGLVSLETLPEWEKEKEIKIFQSVGNYLTFSTAAIAIYGIGKVKAKTRVFRETSQNNFKYHNRAEIGHPIEIQQNADYFREGTMQELYYRPNAKCMISSKTWFLDSERGIPKLMSSSAYDDENRQHEWSLNSVADWQYYGDIVRLNLSTGLSKLNLKYNHSKTSTAGNTLPVFNTQSQSLGWFLRAGSEWNPASWAKVKLQAEYEFSNVESFDYILVSGYAGNQHQFGIRSSVITNPFSRFSISLLLNQEVYNNQISPIMPSISAEYRMLSNENLVVKAAAARNYHFPSLNDLYWQPGGNPNLKPESGYTLESGFAYKSASEIQNFGIDINLFSSKIENWIMWLPHLKGYWEPVNLELVKAKGAEVNLSTNQRIGAVQFVCRGSYSYTRSSIEDAGGAMKPESHGKQLPFIPVHSGGFVFTTIWEGFRLNYTFTHFSERFTTTSNNPNSLRRLYPYYMSSAALGKDFKLNRTSFSFLLRIDNLLNESYQTILWRPMPGRNYSLALRVDL